MPHVLAEERTKRRLRRTRYAAGIALPRETDGRLLRQRRFKTLVGQYAEGLATPLSAPDEALIRQAALLTIRNEELQERFLAGSDVEHDEIIRLGSEFRRVLGCLGNRAKRESDPVSDLQNYLAQKAAEDGDDE
jgi:hypothetical protein